MTSKINSPNLSWAHRRPISIFGRFSPRAYMYSNYSSENCSNNTVTHHIKTKVPIFLAPGVFVPCWWQFEIKYFTCIFWCIYLLDMKKSGQGGWKERSEGESQNWLGPIKLAHDTPRDVIWPTITDQVPASVSQRGAIWLVQKLQVSPEIQYTASHK